MRIDWRRAPGVLVGAGLTCVLLAAPKLLPLFEFMLRRPRLVDSSEWLPVGALFRIFADRNQALERSFSWSYWPCMGEHRLYGGPPEGPAAPGAPAQCAWAAACFPLKPGNRSAAKPAWQL